MLHATGLPEGRLIDNLARELLSKTEERDRYVSIALDAEDGSWPYHL